MSIAEQDVTAPIDTTKTMKVRVTIATRAREAFAGANPVRFVKSNYDHATQSTVELRNYSDVVGGNRIEYGLRNGGDGTDPKYGQITYEPPASIPVSMTPGQKVEGSYVTKSVSGENGELKSEFTVNFAHTYVDRETLETPMGSFKVCKFLHVERQKYGDAPEISLSLEDWVAAEGPYRGQSLKRTARDPEGKLMGGSYVVTSMTYTPK